MSVCVSDSEVYCTYRSVNLLIEKEDVALAAQDIYFIRLFIYFFNFTLNAIVCVFLGAKLADDF